jgi:hypothetical protein
MRNSMMWKVPAGLIAAVLAVASWAPMAAAQDSSFAARVKVPFAFQNAAGQQFDPGVYTITVDGQVMLIRGKDSSGMTLTQLTNDGMPATKGKAVFTRRGDRYFLRAIWFAGKSRHITCNTSKAERAVQIAADRNSTLVELALLQEGR